MADSTLLSEYTFCYYGTAASKATLNPAVPEDLVVIEDIDNNILPKIQEMYDNAVEATADYYDSIEENMMKKASGYASSATYGSGRISRKLQRCKRRGFDRIRQKESALHSAVR